MIARAAGLGRPRDIPASFAKISFFPAAAAVLALAVVADVRVEPVAWLTLGVVVLGIVLLFHDRVFAWRIIVVATALVILLVPIRRETQASSLPFAFEPYRVLLALVVAAWIASLLVDRRVTFRPSFLDGPLIAVFAATTISLLVNAGRITELGLTSEVTKALAFLLGFFLFFWLIVSVIRRFSDVEFVVRALVTCGALISVFTLVEARTGYSIFHQLEPLDPSGLPIRGGVARAFGSAQHPIELSAVLAMLVPLGVYLVQTSRRLWWWLALGLLVVGALVTLSRTGLVMLLVGAAVFLWLRPRETIRLWPLTIPGLVAVHALAPGAIRELIAAFRPAGGLLTKQETVAVGSGRVESLGPALDEVALRPILGGGYGSRVFVGLDANSFIVDDMWLSLLMEVGIVGVAAWAWLLIRFIRRGSKEARRDESHRSWFFAAVTASVTAFTVAMFLFDAFSFIQVTFVLFIVLALAASLLSMTESDGRRPHLVASPDSNPAPNYSLSETNTRHMASTP